VRLRRSDTEEYEPDRSSVLEHFLDPDASFSLSILQIDGDHRNESDAELAYYVIDGDGHIHLGNEIHDLEPEDVIYAGERDHEIEGSLKLLAVRNPPTEDEEGAL
jgi:mannose-6-phosphate isomerase-like protein (cupin superfamily)